MAAATLPSPSLPDAPTQPDDSARALDDPAEWREFGRPLADSGGARWES